MRSSGVDRMPSAGGIAYAGTFEPLFDWTTSENDAVRKGLIV
jgi:hypothetical protein